MKSKVLALAVLLFSAEVFATNGGDSSMLPPLSVVMPVPQKIKNGNSGCVNLFGYIFTNPYIVAVDSTRSQISGLGIMENSGVGNTIWPIIGFTVQNDWLRSC
jgi:hypothetical protein